MLKVKVYEGTAFAALTIPDVHTLLFANDKMLPRTAESFQTLQALMTSSSCALTQYVSSPEAKDHICKKFAAFVATVPRACHVVPGTDAWNPGDGEVKREVISIPLVTLLSVPMLMEELEQIRTSKGTDKETEYQSQRAWMFKTRLPAKVELVLDAKAKKRFKAPSVAELESALDGSVFRLSAPDRRFHRLGVTPADVGICMLLEKTLDEFCDRPDSVLVDDSQDATVLLFSTMPALGDMLNRLTMMQSRSTRTADLRTV